MIPTEQDKELEARLDKIFPCDCSFKKGFAFKPGDPCDGSCVNAPYKKAVLGLITADRKRVELKARLNEVQNAYEYWINGRKFIASYFRDRIALLSNTKESKDEQAIRAKG